MIDEGGPVTLEAFAKELEKTMGLAFALRLLCSVGHLQNKDGSIAAIEDVEAYIAALPETPKP